MNIILNLYSNVGVLENILFIKNILFIILNILFIFLILFFTIFCLKNKNILNYLKNKIRYLIIIPIICILFVAIYYSFPNIRNFININQNTIDMLYVLEIEHDIYDLSNQKNYMKYDELKQKVLKIKNDFIRKDYLNRLIRFKKMINFNINFDNNFKGNIYMGDSRTVALKNILNENEIMEAKSGAKLEHFLIHSNNVEQLLKDNDETYNIILNYGVNDLDNIDKYCMEYNKFLLDISKKHRIYIVSVYPVNDETKIRETKKVLYFNDKIKSCTKNINNLTYCDLYNSTSYQEWIDKYMSKDGLHFNSEGNKYIHNEILSCINDN